MKNLSESVRQRLLNLAKERDDTFDLILSYYGLERLLYRISQSRWKEKLFLKGALLFSTWKDLPHRPTRDLDLLGYGFSDTEYVKQMFYSLCRMDVEDDGIEFEPTSIRCSDIGEGNTYHGIRTKLTALLAGAKIPLQVDIGFGDSITPRPEYIIYPTMLEFPAPELYAYTIYSVIAEKFQAMVVLGISNSRMKDFYDVSIISETFECLGSTLCQSIEATFKRRDSRIPTGLPLAFTEMFFEDNSKITQWKAFLTKKKLEFGNSEFSTVVNQVKKFLMPPFTALQQKEEFKLIWKP